ncbi:MAG TPA: pitrilysin family protein [Vicinamibacterales bacterium]|nr:pitrilysin family protein [Vicinamibacterales bacterium]
MLRGTRVLAALSLAALGLMLPGGAGVQVFAAVRPPKLQYEIATLPNGLTVVTSEDHSTPIVHLNLTYHVGSKNEKPGRTGFAHLFEHLMFKGSKNVLPEAHTSYVASVGGQSNAYTTDDETVFWETVPSQYLPMILWLEADRMATLRIDKDTLTNEREVVKEERRMRVDNQPYGRLNEIIYAQAFTVHPYKHPTIGSMEDLEAASVEDVRDFYNTFYVPSNATLTLVGDFDPVQAQQLVIQYLGRVPKASREVPRDIPKEPPQTKEKRVTLQEPWPLPAVVVAYHITYDGNPDSYPLHIAAKVLSDGDSSRIYKKLVYEKQMAVAAFGSANLIEDPNLFYAVAIVQPGHSPDEVANTLMTEIDRLKTEPISEHELQRTKNQFARDYILNRESNQQKAGVLAHAVVIHNDIKTADGEFDIFQNIAIADVQRVARTYFTPENRLVLTLLPNGQAGRQ